jgi:hypothetical protein
VESNLLQVVAVEVVVPFDVGVSVVVLVTLFVVSADGATPVESCSVEAGMAFFLDGAFRAALGVSRRGLAAARFLAGFVP